MSEKPKTAKRRRVRRAMPAGMVKRGRTYYANFMRDGRRIRKRLSTDFDAAVTMLNELRGRADRGSLELLDNRYPWAELKKLFLVWAKQSTRSAKLYAADLLAFENFSHITCVSMLTPKIVDEWRQARLLEGVTPRTVNRQVNVLRSMLSKGVHRFKAIATNALAGFKPLSHDDPTKLRRAMTPDEVELLFKHSRPDLVPLWRMLLVTGARRDEVVSLRWADVDFDDQSIVIRASVAKGKRSRRVPLDDTMLSMLRELHSQADRRPDGWDHEHVFVNSIGRPWHNNLLFKFYTACRKAGIADAKPGGAVDVHSLRVTFATLALENGASPKAVQAMLGHSTLDMTMQVYAKATDRSKREAVNALPFAKATAPTHVLVINPEDAISGQDLAQIYPKGENRVTA